MLKRIAGSLVLVVALVALCLFVFSNKAKPPQSFRLPNGTVVTLIGITYGTNHTMAWGKPWQRSLYKILPDKLKAWSGASTNTFTTSNTNDPVFWFHQAGPETNGGSPAMRLLDEYGCELDPNGYSMGASYTSHGGSNGKESLSHFQFGAFYPRGKIIGLCVYDSEAKTQRIGNFLIPGEVMKPMPESMQPANLPKPDGELTVQLVSLATGLKSVPCNYFRFTNGGVFSQAIIRVTKNDRPEVTWVPTNIKVTDQNGRAIPLGLQMTTHKEDAAVLNFEGVLDPAAGPFKLRFEFMHNSDYSSEELVSFKDVPFPAEGQSTELQLHAEAQGEQITLERVIGAFAEPADKFQPGGTFFELNMSPATNTIHFNLIQAVDELGNKQPVNYPGTVWGKGKYRFSLPPGTKPKSVDFIFAVHKSRFLEFEATPVLFSTNTTQAIQVR